MTDRKKNYWTVAVSVPRSSNQLQFIAKTDINQLDITMEF